MKERCAARVSESLRLAAALSATVAAVGCSGRQTLRHRPAVSACCGRSAVCRLAVGKGEQQAEKPSEAAANGEEEKSQSSSPPGSLPHKAVRLLGQGNVELHEDWQDRLKQFVLASEKQPLWFRTVDTLLTLTASACFVLSTLTDSRLTVIVLQSIEDVINVIFVVGFLLLCWARGFNLNWLFQASALLDLASCLPVVSIFLRSSEEDLAAYAQMLQVFRFLRLLRETRLVTKTDRRDVPVGTEIFVLSVGFFGLIAVASTVLYIYERDSNVYVSSLIDAFFYMSNVFTSRPPPFSPTTALGKGITIVCFVLALVGIPFFLTEVTALAMKITDEEQTQREAVVGKLTRRNKAADLPEKLSERFGLGMRSGGSRRQSAVEETRQEGLPEGAAFWAISLQTLDQLESKGQLSTEEAAALRLACYSEGRALEMVMMAYSTSSEDKLAARLRECLRAVPLTREQRDKERGVLNGTVPVTASTVMATSAMTDTSQQSDSSSPAHAAASSKSAGDAPAAPPSHPPASS